MLESVADMGIVFNTEFNNKLNCRGDGKLYLLYEAASVFPDAVESQSPNGQILPARIIPISETEFVAVLADFGVEHLHGAAVAAGPYDLLASWRRHLAMLAHEVTLVVEPELGEIQGSAVRFRSGNAHENIVASCGFAELTHFRTAVGKRILM